MEEKPKPKTRIILIAFLCFIILISFMRLLQIVVSPRPNISSSTTESQAGSGPGLRTIAIPTLLPNLTKNWLFYTTNNFQIQYPPDFITETYTLTGQGEAVIIKPASLGSGEYYPSLSISSTPASNSSALNFQIKLLKNFGFQESNIFFHGASAVKMSASLPWQITNKQKVNEPSQETNLLFLISNNSYLITYKYKGDKKDPKMETLFNDILNTFRFIKL